MHELEVWVLVDECGDYAIAKDEDGLADAWDNDIGTTGAALRKVCVKLSVPAPATVVVKAVLPAESSAVQVSVE